MAQDKDIHERKIKRLQDRCKEYADRAIAAEEKVGELRSKLRNTQDEWRKMMVEAIPEIMELYSCAVLFVEDCVAYPNREALSYRYPFIQAIDKFDNAAKPSSGRDDEQTYIEITPLTYKRTLFDGIRDFIWEMRHRKPSEVAFLDENKDRGL